LQVGRGRRRSSHRHEQQQEGGAGGQGLSQAWLLPVAFNRNLLAVFLLANVLTGVVNLSINTLDVGDWQGRGITGKCAAAVVKERLEPWRKEWRVSVHILHWYTWHA
jgi:hypothetical protein